MKRFEDNKVLDAMYAINPFTAITEEGWAQINNMIDTPLTRKEYVEVVHYVYGGRDAQIIKNRLGVK